MGQNRKSPGSPQAHRRPAPTQPHFESREFLNIDLDVRSRRAILFALVVATGWFLGACNSRSPQQPTEVPTVTVSGRILDAIDAQPIAGARVAVRDSSVSSAASVDGSFVLSVPDSTTTRIEITAPGYWRRTTRIDPAGANRVEIDLLPDGKGFSLPFFNYVFRGTCQGQPSTGGTARWLTQPTFEVWLSEFACENLVGLVCTDTRSTGRPVPAAFLSAVTTVLAEDISQLTGGFVSGTPVRYREFGTGTRINYPRDALSDGVITIAYIEDSGLSLGANNPQGVLGISSGFVQVHGLAEITGLTSHEIAHALGYYHPCGGEQVPLPSIMQRAGRPTDADRLHGRILYRRPPGSLSPDSDSDTVTINSAKEGR